VSPKDRNREIDEKLARSRALGERMEQSGARAVKSLREAADALRDTARRGPHASGRAS
jgi:hypothetical protein